MAGASGGSILIVGISFLFATGPSKRNTATVTRKLAILFDGVDFATMTDKQASWELLKRVIEGTEITFRMGDG